MNNTTQKDIGLRSEFFGLIAKANEELRSRGKPPFAASTMAGFALLFGQLFENQPFKRFADHQLVNYQSAVNGAVEARKILLKHARANGPLRRLLQQN